MSQHDGIIRHGDVVSTIARVSSLIRHWGVWDGNAQEIIHAELPVVTTTTWEAFNNGDARIEILGGALGDVIARRARSQLGQKYNLLFRNCEQFGRWAATGTAQSAQLQRAVVGGGMAMVGAWLLFGDHGTYDANGRLRDKKGRFKKE